MIKDFIEANALGARVLSFPSDSSIIHALHVAHLPEHAAAKAVPFVDKKMNFCVVIAGIDESIVAVDASVLFGVVLCEVDDNEVFTLTGFEKKHFPPIAVFGTRIAFHSSISKQKVLLFCLNPREYLLISKEDILHAAEINESLI